MLSTNRGETPLALRLPPLLAVMGLIFALSSRGTLPTPLGLTPELTPVVVHFAIYAALAGAAWWAMPAPTPMGRRLALALLGAVVYGLGDEWLQSFVAGRDPALFDLATHGAGAACALLALRFVEGARGRRTE